MTNEEASLGKPLPGSDGQIYRDPVIVSIFCAAVLYWGWLHKEPNGLPFSRAGALVTVLSLWFVFRRYTQLLADRQKLILEEMQRQLALLKVRPDAAGRLQTQFEGHVYRRRNWIDIALTWWQAALISIGTLVWGFGDIVSQERSSPLTTILWDLIYFGAVR